MNKQYATRLPLKWKGVAEVFAALGDPYRQRILLIFEPGEKLTIKQIADVMPLSRTAVVHHIETLKTAGLLASEKSGREVWLQFSKATLLHALESVRAYAAGEDS